MLLEFTSLLVLAGFSVEKLLLAPWLLFQSTKKKFFLKFLHKSCVWVMEKGDKCSRKCNIPKLDVWCLAAMVEFSLVPCWSFIKSVEVKFKNLTFKICVVKFFFFVASPNFNLAQVVSFCNSAAFLWIFYLFIFFPISLSVSGKVLLVCKQFCREIIRLIRPLLLLYTAAVSGEIRL